ncbi:MAG TPA: methylmalonyl-CoA mutase family protein, partial [Candidatus Melainabacteria bacterium]|nr:methylmalonyl-CoA mutase family protein [Candidatus Melainabacteria bacterium]
RIFVGLNGFTEEADGPGIEILKIGRQYQDRQVERLKKLKAKRDQAKVTESLEKLKDVLRNGGNSFPLILEAVKTYATMGEVCDAMREVHGAYRETAVL